MKKIFTFLMTAVLIMASVSCSNDEPENTPFPYDGVKVYQNVIDKLYDNDGKPAYTPTATKGIYVASATGYGQSYRFICGLIGNDNWCGGDVTIALGKDGENGTLRIVGESDDLIKKGIYNEIIVNIQGGSKDYEPFTLDIITEEQAENGYYGGGVPIKRIEEE